MEKIVFSIVELSRKQPVKLLSFLFKPCILLETLMAIWGLIQALENCRLPDKSLMQDFEQMLECVA